jgi:hypothetical protein
MQVLKCEAPKQSNTGAVMRHRARGSCEHSVSHHTRRIQGEMVTREVTPVQILPHRFCLQCCESTCEALVAYTHKYCAIPCNPCNPARAIRAQPVQPVQSVRTRAVRADPCKPVHPCNPCTHTNMCSCPGIIPPEGACRRDPSGWPTAGTHGRARCRLRTALRPPSTAGKGRETQRLHRAASVRETDSQYARSPKIWRI